MIEDPYKKSAQFYDAFVEPFTIVLRNNILKMNPPEKGMHVLEVGCGTGINLQFYQKFGCSVYGIDLSPSMVGFARKKFGRQVDIKLENASRMSYPRDFFDLVIAMLTLHEMPDSIRPLVMNEMVRVMKKNGRLLLVDFHPGPISFPQGWLSKIIILFFEKAAGKEHYQNYKNFIAAKGLPPLIKQNNLYIRQKRIVSGGNLALFSTASVTRLKHNLTKNDFSPK